MNALGPIAILLVSAVCVAAETVTTTDGRTIELSADGTYKILEDTASAQIALAGKTPFFEPFAGEYGQNSMRFMPIFQNDTGKTVVGFKFHTSFVSAFGDEVFAFDGESSEKITAGSTSTSAAFYYFEDNQFIGDEPYDILTIFESSGTGKILTKVTAVVFDDGKVIKAP